MLEHLVVDYWNVNNREHSHKPCKYGPEQEWVPPDMPYPEGNGVFRLRLHPEKGPPHMNHLPGEEESKPC